MKENKAFAEFTMITYNKIANTVRFDLEQCRCGYTSNYLMIQLLFLD